MADPDLRYMSPEQLCELGNVVDLEVYKASLLEPVRFHTVALSEDGAHVTVDIRGEIEPGAAEVLGTRLLEVARIARMAR